MPYLLPGGETTSGAGWTTVNDMQYMLARMSASELATIGVSIVAPPAPIDTRFYYQNDLGDPIPRSMDDVKQTLKGIVAAERWGRQTGGIMVNTIFVRTDEYTQQKLFSAYQRAREDPTYTVPDWKMSDGSYTALNKSMLDMLYLAVENHLKECFARNHVIDDQIDLLTTVEEAQAFTWVWE